VPSSKKKLSRKKANHHPFSQRRRAQNRASQRAYRERKDQRIKDLEQMLDDAKQRNDVLSQAYATLHAEYVALKSSSSIGDGAGYPSQYDSMPYGAAAAAAGLGGAAGAGAGDGLEGMDMFVYGDLSAGGYHAL
jgi:hypothetical protein